MRAYLERLAGTLRLIHWRLREVHLRCQPVDLVAFAANGPLGRIDLASVPLVDGNLSVDGRAIRRATAATLRNCLSIAAERHQASNWLRGDDPVYSRVDPPT